MNPEPGQPAPLPPAKKPFPVVVLVIAIGALGLCCFAGLGVAIAVPSFMKYKIKANQSECRMMLRRAYVAERAYYEEKDEYVADPKTVDFDLRTERTRWVYAFGPAENGPSLLPASSPMSATMVQPTAAEAVREMNKVMTLGVTGKCPDCAITIGCAANVDSDEELDIWSISTADRVDDEGVLAPQGVVFQHNDDLGDKPGIHLLAPAGK